MSGIPEFLQRRANKLGLVISIGCFDCDDLDLGPFLLWGSGYRVWEGGLPIEGIVDALNCYERELKLPEGSDEGEAWKDFGATWR
jgi:hypothetical protein